MSLKKRYLTGSAARKKLLGGAKIVYDLVACTSGPKGRNTAFSRPWGLPRIINDGIEIAKEVGSEDDYENVGIDLIREAATNTVTDAGDGTTTSIILAYHTLKKGIESIDRAGNPANPMVLRAQMLAALEALLGNIHTLSTKISSREELEKVALISSSYDAEIAEVVSKVVHEMGTDGIVTVEEGNGMTITNEITKGMQLQKGYLSPVFVTDDMRMESVIVDPCVIIFDQPISSQGEIVPILNEAAKRSKNIVIFGDIRGDAMNVLVLNKVRGIFQLLAVNPPGYQEQRLAILNDIAAVTGAKVITSESTSFHASDMGSASHISANKNTTTIADGKGAKEVIAARVEEIRRAREDSEATLYEREKFEERLGKLTAGVSVIRAGAKTETLNREKYEKIKDAVGATKAALSEGIVTGGGMTFIELAKQHKGKRHLKDMNEGEQILFAVLLEPTFKLLLNAGKTLGEANNLIDQLIILKKNEGFNINTDKIEDLMKSGVIDPLRVIRLSLENGVTVATSIFTTEGLIVDAPKPEHQQG